MLAAKDYVTPVIITRIIVFVNRPHARASSVRTLLIVLFIRVFLFYQYCALLSEEITIFTAYRCYNGYTSRVIKFIIFFFDPCKLYTRNR